MNPFYLPTFSTHGITCGCDEPGHVYLAVDPEDTSRVKIGYTSNWNRRSLELAPARIAAIAPGCFALETQIHKHYADMQIDGEWFRLEGALRELVSYGLLYAQELLADAHRRADEMIEEMT